MITYLLCDRCATAITNDDMSGLERADIEYVRRFQHDHGNVTIDIETVSVPMSMVCDSCGDGGEGELHETHEVRAAAEMYLDYVNNFLTTTGFAEHYGITADVALRVIEQGRIDHENSLPTD